MLRIRATTMPRGEWLAPAAIMLALLGGVLAWHPADRQVLALGLARGHELLVASYTQPKGWAAGIGSLLAAVATWRSVQRRSARASCVAVPLALVAGALMSISAAATANPVTSLAELRGYACMLALFAATLSSVRAQRVALAAIQLTAVALAVIVLLEVDGHYQPGIGAEYTPYLLRPVGGMHHRNVAAVLLCTGLPLLLVSFAGRRRPIAIGAHAAALAAVALALVATSARVSCAAALIATVWSFVATPRLRALPAARWIFVAAFAATLVAAHTHGAAAAPIRDPLLAKISVSLSKNDYSSNERRRIWRRALTLVAEHPLLGSGSGSFARTWNAEQPWSTAPNAHDSYVEAAVSYGLPCALLLAIATAFVVGGALRLRPHGEGDALAGGVAAALLALLLISLFECVDLMLGVNLHAAALAGTAAAWHRRSPVEAR